jgi:hypothetical protein
MCFSMLQPAAPFGWQEIGCDVIDARRFIRGRLMVIAGEETHDSRRWLHVSCSLPDRLPSWEQLQAVKDAFVGEEHTALQVLPPKAQHFSHHPYCLHLWHAVDGSVVPDFRRFDPVLGGMGI